MPEVLIRVEGACGRITLNRPRELNAISLGMTEAITAALREWAEDAAIGLVLVDGAGERGLCAGGDIRELYRAASGGDYASAAHFFRREYELNFLVSRFPKPYVALMDGIVMGGGIGISAHGSHRIVTERSVLAMPETAIGFVPDVGGTYLLGRVADEFGTYLALTAGRIGAQDALLCGLADTFASSDALPVLTAELERCTTATEVDRCVAHFARSSPPPGRLQGNRGWIKDCFCENSAEAILAALDAHAAEGAQQAAIELRSKSPTSLKVTLEAVRRARESEGLRACLEREYTVSTVSVQQHDFREGVRAAVIDKDRAPQWKPARLQDVSETVVQAHFAAGEFGTLEL